MFSSDWLKIFSSNQKHYPVLDSDTSSVQEFLRSFLRRHFAGIPAMALPNVGSFLRLNFIKKRQKIIDPLTNLSYQ